MRWIVLLCALVGAVAAGLGTTAAQQASPEAAPASACTVEPYSLEQLQAVVATPVAATPVAEASPFPVELPAGEPADAATTEAVTGTIRELVACLNAGDFLRALAVYDDDFVRAAFAGSPITQETYDQLAEVTPRDPDQRLTTIAFSEVVVLADGRAAVLVTGDDLANPEEASTTLFYLVETDGRWLVNELVESDSGE